MINILPIARCNDKEPSILTRMTNQRSLAGVPVFLADAKGDLPGLGVAAYVSAAYRLNSLFGMG
ncbi:MAG TPA: helicase HerA-like domain-containing protein [Rugosibacter sp.]